MLIAGSAVGVQASNSETTQRSAGAVTAAQSADAAVTTSVDKSAKALDVAKAAKGYDKADGAATLLAGVDKATGSWHQRDRHRVHHPRSGGCPGVEH